MSILVTGGAGFIGSHVVDELINMGEEVIILDDLSGGFLENVNNKADFVKGSIIDEKIVKAIFKNHEIEYIFHIAAYAAEGLSHFIKKFNYENNLLGSVNLINEAINNNVRCFVFTSSIAVYGINQLPMKEDMVPMPEDSYGIAKLAVEQELKVSKEMFNLNYVIFRPHNVYGERQNIGDKYRNVVGIFMNQIMDNKPLTIFGDGNQSRAFSYIKDVAPVIAKSIYVKEAYSEIFNVGSDTIFTVNQLADEVCRAMNASCNINYLDARNEVKHAFSSHDKLIEYFAYKSRYTLEEGLKNMAEWAKKTGVKKSKKFEKIEILRNLPEIWADQDNK